MKTITIDITGGIVDVVRQSPGTKLIVLDYDCEEMPDSDPRVKLDKEGKPHYRTTTTRKEKP